MLCALKKNGSAADRCFKREKGLADLDLFTKLRSTEMEDAYC